MDCEHCTEATADHYCQACRLFLCKACSKTETCFAIVEDLGTPHHIEEIDDET